MFIGRESIQKTMLRLLSGLARWQRQRLSGLRVIAITGSAGKTTAKGLLFAILQTRMRGRANRLSYNRPHRIARQLLTMTKRDEFLVQEVSVEQPGGMDEPLRLLQPRIGLVTCIGFDHYSAFRGPENVALEKGKLVRALPADGWAILNADDPLVLAMREGAAAQIRTYGQASDADLRASEVAAAWPDRLAFTVQRNDEIVRVQTQLLGAHWLPSVLGAMAAAQVMGIPLSESAAVIAATPPVPGRMFPVVFPDGVTFIRDDWKNPLWMIAPTLEFMKTARASRKIVVFGNISDYSGGADRKYPAVARQAVEAADHVFFVGPQARLALKAGKQVGEGRLRAFDSLHALHEFLQTFLQAGDLVLIKGSNRADHLERLTLARQAPISCWMEKCGRSHFCNACSKLKG